MVLKPYSRATETCSFSSFYEIGRISYCISFSIAALPKSVVHIFCFYYLICQTFAKSTEKTAISNPGGGGGGGYSLYSDDRDDRRVLGGCNRRFGIFRGCSSKTL